MFDRSEMSEMIERITHGVSCRMKHRGMTLALLGAGLLVALTVILLLLRRRGAEELLDEDENGWDGESLPDTFPDTLRERNAGDLGEGDDAAIPGGRARRTRRPAGGLSSAEGDIAPQPV
jgi:hypothetical protein